MNAARRFPFRWTAAWLWTLCAVAASAQTQTPQQIAQKALASTVLVVAGNAEGEIAGVGSGFFVRSGLIATNQHVINGETVIGVRLVNQERFHRIDSVAARDEELDLALLRVSSLSAPALPLGDSDKLQIGEPIYAVGNPVGFLEGTFSDGLVSGIRALPNLKLIQMTAPISQGSSGGPVLNAKGEVVGVSTAGIKLGQNLNFAVPSNALKKMLERIRDPNLIVPTPRPKPTFPTPRPQPAASPDRFADYMKWSLPKGSKARLGKGSISDIVFAPDGKTLAVGGSVGIWIYDALTGRELSLIKGLSGMVFSVAYSKDGWMIASGCGKAIQINSKTGALLRTLTGHTRSVTSVAYSPDGRTIASGSFDETVRIWNVQTGALLHTLTGHTEWINSVAYSPDGRTLASGSYGQDGSDMECANRRASTQRSRVIRMGAFLWRIRRTAERLLAAATTRQLGFGTRKQARFYTRLGGIRGTCAYSPDGRTLASGGSDKTIRIWNAQTGAQLRTLTGHTGRSHPWRIPGRQTIASGSQDQYGSDLERSNRRAAPNAHGSYGTDQFRGVFAGRQGRSPAATTTRRFRFGTPKQERSSERSKGIRGRSHPWRIRRTAGRSSAAAGARRFGFGTLKQARFYTRSWVIRGRSHPWRIRRTAGRLLAAASTRQFGYGTPKQERSSERSKGI